MSAVAALLLSLMGTDRLGDPTPPGVMARYGTTRLWVGRFNSGDLRFHPIRDELYCCANGALKAAEKSENNIIVARGWKLPSGAEVFRHRVPPERDILHDIVFDRTGRYRLMVYTSESRVWDEVTRKEIATVSHWESMRDDGGVVGFQDGRIATRRSTRLGGNKPGQGVDVIQSERFGNVEPDEGKVGVGEMAAVVLSPCGKRLWVAEETPCEVRSFSAISGEARSWRRVPAEEDVDPNQVFSKASADGRKLVTIQNRQDRRADRYRGYPECFVQVFDTASNRVEARYAFRLDDIGTDERLKPPEDYEQAFRDFLPSNDGKFLAWTDEWFRLRIRHLPTGRVVTVKGEQTRRPMAFSPDDKRLAVCDHDGTIRLIDPHTGRFQHTADSPPTAAKQTAISPDGKWVATGHACGEVWVWDAATGKPLWHTEPEGELRELHFNPTGTTVSAVGFWGQAGVRTFDAKTGKELGPMLPCQYYRTVAVSADGKRIVDLEVAAVQEKGEWWRGRFVRTRDLTTGKTVGRVRLDQCLEPRSDEAAVVSRDGRVMIVTHTDGDTFAYDTATGKRLAEFDPPKRGPSPNWIISDDGRMVIHTASRLVSRITMGATVTGGTATVYDLTSQQPGKPIRAIDSGLMYGRLGLSPDGRYLAFPRTVYDIRTGEESSESHMAIAGFFPDGKSVLTLPGIRGAERVSLEPLGWKVAPPPKPSEARLKQLWAQLGEPAALDAVFELARHSAVAVPFLKAKLLTEPPDAKVVAAHVAHLGSKAFAEREAATKSLRDFGPEVLPALRAALKTDPSPEARVRLDKLIAGHADTTSPFTLARLRAVEALERCGTTESRDVLKTLAETRPGTPWADDAARALARIKR